ncbi:uncharacterized protein G2W53_036019 [Senna tora]|uniref:Uncharacterized protein n=1 Tax=Senna tora TaxID=362788 RepID=A0A834ST82_9FABA|nr:uncharacterized protein G2W53_036019 [Senna tora]
MTDQRPRKEKQQLEKSITSSEANLTGDRRQGWGIVSIGIGESDGRKTG